MREFTCIYCGAKGIDNSRTKTKKFCDCNCQQAYYRRQHGVGVGIKAPACIHNREVRCFVHMCGTCGWNPKVEKKRKEALGYG
jgi:hypothetical protein